jgi:predicted ATPase
VAAAPRSLRRRPRALFLHSLAHKIQQKRASPRRQQAVESDEQITLIGRTGERWYEAEVNRIRPQILLRFDPASATPAENDFLKAISIAKEQRTRSFGLRAALALAKLHQRTGRPADARAVLAPALEGFSPTPEMPEIAKAQVLLGDLV